jgi:TatD DNase family protein
MFLVDSHCHLDMLDLKPEHGDLHSIIERARENGVHYFLNVCVSLAAFPDVLTIAKAYPFVSASVGLHPNDRDEEASSDVLVKLGQHEKVVAIGETGLDYFRTSGEIKWQQERFRAHIDAARRLQKPLIVHTREAKEDTLRIMQEERVNEIGGVMHCFTEDWECAKKALDMNFYISISGIVTFKNAATIQEVAKNLPLDRLLVETDSPYLAPNPHRGKQNEPAYVRHTAEYIAHLRNIPIEALAEQTTQNFFTLFKGAKRPHV